MSIIQRLWPQETPVPDADTPLSQRLKDLVGKDALNDSQGDAGKPAEPAKTNASAPPGEQPQPDSAAETTPLRPAPGRERQEKSMENRSPDAAAVQAQTEEPSRNPSASSAASKGPGQQFMERFHAAVGRTEPSGEKSQAAGPAPAPEFQAIQKQFEADFRKRLDGALAEFERRVSSQALVDDVAGQIEQRLRLAADGIFQEAKSQALTMHNAVAGELRSFREQFGKEIEERVGVLDQAAQNALQLKQKMDEALPKAEEALRSLAASGEQAAARFEAESKAFEDRLRQSHEEMSRQVDAQRQDLQTLAQGLQQDGLERKQEMEKFQSEAAAGFEAQSKAFEERLRQSHEEMSRQVDAQRQDLQALAQGLQQDGLQWKEEMEKFRGEAGAAGELLGRRTDESLEKLSTAADEAGARAKEGIENLAAEVERRVLSGGLVERATEQLGQATREMVDPAMERIRQAGEEAHAAAGTLAGESQRVAVQLDAARQQIEARLDSLLAEQLNMVDGAMSGFQQKAGEELGNLVERVVAQSTSQLDDRLHGLLQDLFANTSQQINTVARATLSQMNEGLKEAFQPDPSAAAQPGPDAANP